MAAKTGRHRYGTKSRHCHFMYTLRYKRIRKAARRAGPSAIAGTCLMQCSVIDQSIAYFRVVQVIISLEDPLEVGNNLPGINDNVRDEAWNRNVLKRCGRLTETGQISRCPAGCSRWWVRRPGEGPAADGRQFPLFVIHQ